MTRVRPGTALLLGFLAAVLGCGFAHGEPAIDKPAPALVVNTLDGQVFDLSKLRGDVVLVNYWATWCAPCRKDMPKLDAFYRLHHQQNLAMIGISVDRPRDLEKVRKVMASLAYPVAMLKGVTVDGFGAAGRRADHLDHRCRRQGPRPHDRCARRTAQQSCRPTVAALNEDRM